LLQRRVVGIEVPEAAEERERKLVVRVPRVPGRAVAVVPAPVVVLAHVADGGQLFRRVVDEPIYAQKVGDPRSGRRRAVTPRGSRRAALARRRTAAAVTRGSRHPAGARSFGRTAVAGGSGRAWGAPAGETFHHSQQRNQSPHD